MTATIKPPKGASRPTLRFSSLESLGFSDAAFTWSETPPEVVETTKGRHEATVADLKPLEFGSHLNRGNTRWSLVLLAAVIFAGLAALGYWLFQRPAAVQDAALSELVVTARALDEAIPELASAAAALGDAETVTDGPALADVEREARSLFEISGSVASLETRTAASQAAGATLDALRLVRETGSYRAAVAPVLIAPPLETDPELIALDEAARSFGNWQLAFNDMRTALPEGVLPEVSEEIGSISSGLTTVLDEYMDALRQDDQEAAALVLSTLGSRLSGIGRTLDTSIEDIQRRVRLQLEEAVGALAGLGD
jgi:hypothetical protein